jgi:hypothetical protein
MKRQVLGISGECQLPSRSYQQPDSSGYPVRLDTASKFSSCSDTQFTGIISNQQHTELVQALLDETSLTLQVTCNFGDENLERPKIRRYLPCMRLCSLRLTIYGPAYLCDDVGSFFQDYDIYLQDPRGCEMDVRYCNPHRLSSIDLASCPMTSKLELQEVTLGAFNLEEAPRQLDLLAVLDSQEALQEAPQPDAIHTTLER